jgi:hypothetical protein
MTQIPHGYLTWIKVIIRVGATVKTIHARLLSQKIIDNEVIK